MRTGATKPEWDTPPDGDFASYVQRLTAQPQAAAPRAQQSSAAPESPVAAAGGPQPSREGASLAPSQFALGWAPFDAGLRTARAVVLVLVALHALALAVFGLGSLVGLIAMAGVWWGLGALRTAGRRALESADRGQPPLTLHDVQERLRALALQRTAGQGAATHKRNDKRKT